MSARAIVLLDRDDHDVARWAVAAAIVTGGASRADRDIPAVRFRNSRRACRRRRPLSSIWRRRRSRPPRQWTSHLVLKWSRRNRRPSRRSSSRMPPEPIIEPPPPMVEPVVALPEPPKEPPPPPEVKVEPKPKPPEVKRVERKKPAPRTSASPRSERNTADTPASPNAGAISQAAQASWRDQVVSQLQRAKRYPSGAESRREQGVVTLSFTLSRGGSVLGRSIARSSGNSEFDQEVLAMVMRAQPFPPFPAGMNQSSIGLSVPVHFSLR